MTRRRAPSLAHLLELLDDTGIAQHTTYGIVARAYGYCLDDNARGLLLAATLKRMGLHRAEADRMFATTAAFVQHAWDEETGRFHNFMSFDRRWLERVGSEDSHGRAVWALGATVRDVTAANLRNWAMEMLKRGTRALASFTSPRALAYGLLGMLASQAESDLPDFSNLIAQLADRLCDHLGDNRAADWVWFERSLSYDNARLAQAVLAAGRHSRRQDWQAAGLATLQWLCRVQTAATGCFRPVGSNGFWHRGGLRAEFDQQPIEASATIAATLYAWQVTRDRTWLTEAERSRRWFLGDNDLGLPLIDSRGACCDGLHPDRVNANQGAESTLAWLQAEIEYQEAIDTAGATNKESHILQFAKRISSG